MRIYISQGKLIRRERQILWVEEQAHNVVAISVPWKFTLMFDPENRFLFRRADPNFLEEENIKMANERWQYHVLDLEEETFKYKEVESLVDYFSRIEELEKGRTLENFWRFCELTGIGFQEGER